jgi:hypothetical protein
MPLKRWRWLKAHVRPIDALLPVLALLATTWLWWPLLFPPPPPPFAYGRDPFPVHPRRAARGRHARRGGDALQPHGRRPDLRGDAAGAAHRPRASSGRCPPSGRWCPPGCVTVHSKAHTLPADLPPGRYRLLFVATVLLDSGQVTAAGRSADFDVVNGSGGER